MGIVPVDPNCRSSGEIFVDVCLAARSGDMGSLLDLASKWTHRDLTLYVDDSAIFVISTTTDSTTKSVIKGFNGTGYQQT
jgi:hypothetical protein